MNFILLIGAVLGFSSLVMAAFLDHAIALHITAKELNSLLTALRYHQLYAVVISVMGMIMTFQISSVMKRRFVKVASTFLVGVLLFSCSIYVTYIFHFPNAIRLTPIGGVILMLGWLGLAWIALSREEFK